MHFIIIESFVFSGLSRNRCAKNLSVLKSQCLYQSLYLVLRRFYQVLNEDGYRRRKASNLIRIKVKQSLVFLKVVIAHTVAVQQNLNLFKFGG